jgi:hypothetical protein
MSICYVNRLLATALVVGWVLTSPQVAHAQNASSSTVAGGTTTPVERDAFTLGYCLGYSRIKAYNFLDSVKSLQDATSDASGGAMVSNLIDQGEATRRLEAETFRRAAALIHALNGPAKSEQWAKDNAAALIHPFAIPPKRGDTPASRLTDHLTAIIDDTSTVQKGLVDMLANLEPALQATDGVSASWSVDAGSFTAKVSFWDGSPDSESSLESDARQLVEAEPAGTPAAVDKALRAIIPPPPSQVTIGTGTGNLANLLPSHANQVAAMGLQAEPGALLNAYGASDTAEALDQVQ